MVVSTSAVFAALLFTQTFPPVTRASGLVANCTTLSVIGAVPTVGTAGFVQFGCGASDAAFSVPTGVTATPTFTLPAGYLSLSANTVPASFACGTSGLPVFTSGTPITLGATGYTYCAQVDATTVQLATFDVSWAS